MPLDTTQQMLIEQRVANDAKSPLIAYLLLLFVGGFGAHRFYLGHTGSAVLMLVLWIVGWVTLPIMVGIVPLGVVGVWVFIDLFLVPGMVARDKDRVRRLMRGELELAAGNPPPWPCRSPPDRAGRGAMRCAAGQSRSSSLIEVFERVLASTRLTITAQ